MIVKKTLGNETYYYLQHSRREGASVRKKELYLGKQIPKNIDALKGAFAHEMYKERWYSIFNKVKEHYSKEQAHIPLSSKKEESKKFTIKFTYNTQKIEGSKLTLRETAELLENGITPSSKPLIDVLEAESHRTVFEEMLLYQKELSLQLVLEWHKKLFQKSKPDIAGKIRRHSVAISGSRFIPPLAVEVYPLLREFFSWYSANKAKLHPVELAARVHLRFVTIHPFADGNGRISRLIMNFVLHKNKYPMLDIPYEKRNSYYNALERSQVKKIDDIFVQWLFRRYEKEYRRYVKK